MRATGTDSPRPASTSPASTSPASTSPASTSPASTSPASTSPASTSPASTSPASTSPAAPARPLDDTLGFITRGYGFGRHLWRRARSASARAVPMRILGREALLVRGEAGVRLFYDESRVRRHGAMPKVVGEPLFGHGSVHSLDGEEHRHRKATFVDAAYEDAQVERVAAHFEREWRDELEQWARGGQRTAYDAAVGALGRGIMRWAGLPGSGEAKTRWAAQLAQIVDGFGVPYSPEYLQSWANRRAGDRHAAELIDAVRAGTLEAAEGTALRAWAWHRGLDGELLPAKLAGIELQNILRPTIAVARFVAFAAKELHDRPEWRERIAAETAERGGRLVGGPLAVAFAQEVRRTAFFVPMLPALAKVDLEHDGERIAAGETVFLDIYGTNRDAESWERADEFDPERFLDVDFEAIPVFVPQGGGEVPSGHRCPGEKIAVAGLSGAVAALSDPRISVLGGGLHVNERRFPTKPASGGRIRAVTVPATGLPAADLPAAGLPAAAAAGPAEGRCPVAH